MIKVLLIEDELPARKKMIRFLNELPESINVVAEIDTIAQGIAFLKTNAVDLIFSDIELLDGTAFEIFEQVALTCPIIFTTAYDNYWINAFETNGIAYLLKPFSMERFQKAWNKFLLLYKSGTNTNEMVEQLAHFIESNTIKKYKSRFTVSAKQSIYFLAVDAITFFQAEESVIFAYDSNGKKHLLNESTLKEIELQLDPDLFFRINRSELVQKKYIEKIERYSKNAYAVTVTSYPKVLITSQNNAAEFRNWVEE